MRERSEEIAFVIPATPGEEDGLTGWVFNDPARVERPRLISQQRGVGAERIRPSQLVPH